MNPSLALRHGLSLVALFATLSVAPVSIALGQPSGHEARLAAALAEPRALARLEALAAAAAQLGSDEIPAALAAGERLPELRQREVWRESVFKRWARLAPADTFAALLQQPPGRLQAECLRLAALEWAQRDPQAAAAAAASLPSSRAQLDAIATIAEVWARTHAPVALAWAEALPAQPAREAALHNIRFIWVHQDPAAAAAPIAALPPGEIKDALLMNIAGEWAARDPQAALVWAASLDSSAEKSLAYAHIAESWADEEPAAAAEFARGLAPEWQNRALLAALSRWAVQAPALALQWASERTDAPLFVDAVNAILVVWAPAEPGSARAWIEHAPAGPVRDAAIRGFVDALLPWDPAAAAEMAAKLGDATSRTQYVEQAVARWSEIDPVGASRWPRPRSSAAPPPALLAAPGHR